MEIAQRYSIAYKGLKNGAHEFDFAVDKTLFEAFESAEIKDGDCSVKVRMLRSETQLQIDVTIRGEVVVECDRCLEDCRIPVEFDGQLLVKFSDEVQEYDGEVLWLLPGEDMVDLSQYIYESIILSLPYQRVHPQGECNPEMLARFNIVTDEEFARIETRSESGHDAAWDKLSQLKAQMEADKAPKASKAGKTTSAKK